MSNTNSIQIFHTRTTFLGVFPVMIFSLIFIIYANLHNNFCPQHIKVLLFILLFLGIPFCISMILIWGYTCILEVFRHKPYINICDDMLIINIYCHNGPLVFLYSDIDSIELEYDIDKPCLALYLKEESEEKYIETNLIFKLLCNIQTHIFDSDRVYSIYKLNEDPDYIVAMLQEKLEQYNLRTNGNNIE